MANTEHAPKFNKITPAPNSRIQHAVSILSGKGGVGKSFTTSYLAVRLSRMGYKVGILDADITGPSIPFSFRVEGPIPATSNQFFYPLKSRTGIEIMSSNLLMNNPKDPIMWRGPMIGTLCQQFYTDVIWDVDYLLIDMAPGTSDVSLTVFQNVSLSSAVLVATPQNLVSLIVEKSAKMADMLSVPVLSLVENMAYVECPCCKKRIEIYGKTDPHLCSEHGIPHFDEVPFDARISQAMDSGTIEDLDVPYLEETAKAIVATGKADEKKLEEALKEFHK